MPSTSIVANNNSAMHRPSIRASRPCNNCTCSPGLLSRQRRSTLLLKRVETNRKSKRRNSMNSAVGDDSASIYSSDTLCQTSKEVNTSDRLLALRKQMEKFDLCCYIVPSEDEHQSEYVAPIDQKRSFISGFSGSAGIACITRDLLNFNANSYDGKSVLSTDGRYFNQASQELDFNWSLLRQGIDKITWQEWCIKESREMSQGLGGKHVKIGVDPKLFSFEQIFHIQKLITAENNNYDNCDITLEPVEENLIDLIWDKFEDVPKRSANPLMLLPDEISGETFKSKRDRLFKKIAEDDIENENKDINYHFIVTALDEICWLLNLRGSDIDYNPVFFSYLLINNNDTFLYTNNTFDGTLEAYFTENNITIKPYASVWDHLTDTIKTLSSVENVEKGSTETHKFLIPDSSSWKILRSMDKVNYKIIHSPIDIFKSIKNRNELNNAHRAQVKDAICLVQYYAWLENQLVVKEALIDEYKAAKKLIEIRKTQKNYFGNSFETISSTGANAAVIHYSPPKEGSSMIDPSKIYLCDAGSQFLEGTTDITRTLHFCVPTDEEKDCYTRVLKGNLAVERLKFPEGTSGYNIDVLARQFLWSKGLDYRHGTGHGVGSFLNVHEGPIGIGYKPHLVNYPLQAGNVITNEPGFYKDGDFGIRIENDMVVEKVKDVKFGETEFLQFDNITLVPYCQNLIKVELLTEEEKEQINKYHSKIWDDLVQYLQPQSITYKWLKRETTPL